MPLPEKAEVGKASLRRCLWGCDLTDTNQLCRNIRKSVPGRRNSQGKGPDAGTGMARWKAAGSEGVEWVRPMRAGLAHQGLGGAWGCSGAEAVMRVTSGVTVFSCSQGGLPGPGLGVLARVLGYVTPFLGMPFPPLSSPSVTVGLIIGISEHPCPDWRCPRQAPAELFLPLGPLRQPPFAQHISV